MGKGAFCSRFGTTLIELHLIRTSFSLKRVYIALNQHEYSNSFDNNQKKRRTSDVSRNFLEGREGETK